MKKLIILILTTLLLQSCRICCNGNPKLTTRYMSTCIDSMDLAPNIKVPDIIAITDVTGTKVNQLSDGVYIVVFSDNTRIMVVN